MYPSASSSSAVREGASDKALRDAAAELFRLWDFVRQVFAVLPNPVSVAEASPQRWEASPPTRATVPKLVHEAARQPLPAEVRVEIMTGVRAWAKAFTLLAAIGSLPRDERPVRMYLDALRCLYECADQLTRAVASLGRGPRRSPGAGPRQAGHGAPGSRASGPAPEADLLPGDRLRPQDRYPAAGIFPGLPRQCRACPLRTSPMNSAGMDV